MRSDFTICVSILLTGDVQGLGIRPRVASLALQRGLQGTVRNTRRGVEIVVVGTLPDIDALQALLVDDYPNVKQDRENTASSHAPLEEGFHIIDSDAEGDCRFVVPLDRVICDECLRECSTPGHRRFGYALNGCSQCGPRYSILQAMPYDRNRTSMLLFSMCSHCQSEYMDPAHRRFHAQTNCCPECGPTIWFESEVGQRIESDLAIEAAARAIQSGQIVALKGLGGYQLLCDATQETAVARMRQRKARPTKPLAVMVDSLDAAQALAQMDPLERAILDSTSGPIVIVESRPGTQLSSSIHPGLKQIGLMLPTTGLHALLLKLLARPLVVTSGNREAEPLEYEEAGARQRLAGIADCFVHHNRRILNPVDDSVVRCMAGRQVTIRAARGVAPLALDCDLGFNLVGLGGQQKSAIALSHAQGVVLGPHLGDLNSVLSRQRFEEQSSQLLRLMGCRPQAVVRDMHPDYFTSRETAVPCYCVEDGGGIENGDGVEDVLPVQHHHAHVASAMVQHGWLRRRVLGFAFDGTGWGSDGGLWGGEVLLAEAHQFERVAQLRPFRLAGGEAAIRQPWRIGIALLIEACGEASALDLCRERLLWRWEANEGHIRSVSSLLKAPAHAPSTTSMGRLFDGVAAILCGIEQTSFEGEAAMRLEAMSAIHSDGAYSVTVATSDSNSLQIDWRPLMLEIVADLKAGVKPGSMAMKFHRAVANCVAHLAKRFPKFPVVLTGGVFQNRLLVELIDELLREHPSPLGLPGIVPPNDGGLALGQVVVGASQLARRTKTCA